MKEGGQPAAFSLLEDVLPLVGWLELPQRGDLCLEFSSVCEGFCPSSGGIWKGKVDHMFMCSS